MAYQWLLAAHVAVLGYWLGSELVINSTYRYVCYHDEMALADRTRLMGHVMHVDQHVRYALVLQASLGTMLAAYLGYLPGGTALMTVAAVVGVLWLGFVEVVHKLSTRPVGKSLSAFDRGSRYVLMAVLVAIALGLIGSAWSMPGWLRWKLACFAGVMACGVGIRLSLLGHFRTWAVMERDGPTAETNAVIRHVYVRSTAILVLLWVFIAAVAFMSVQKPG